MEPRIDQWKLTSIGMAVVIVAAFVTGLLLALWYGDEISRLDVASSQEAAKLIELSPRNITPAASPDTARAQRASSLPPTAVTETCNQQAARVAGAEATREEKAVDVAKDGTAVGVVGVGAGTLYGISTSRENDERYRAAYSSCMRGKGYTT